jgi:hypothetical protein
MHLYRLKTSGPSDIHLLVTGVSLFYKPESSFSVAQAFARTLDQAESDSGATSSILP